MSGWLGSEAAALGVAISSARLKAIVNRQASEAYHRGRGSRTGAAAVSIVLLLLSFLVLLALRYVGSRAAKREELAA